MHCKGCLSASRFPRFPRFPSFPRVPSKGSQGSQGYIVNVLKVSKVTLQRFPQACQGSQVNVSSFPRNHCKGTRGFQSRHLNGAKGPCDETKKGQRISPTARKKWPRSFCKNIVHAMDISCVRMYDSLCIISCTLYFIRMTLYAYVLYIPVVGYASHHTYLGRTQK